MNSFLPSLAFIEGLGGPEMMLIMLIVLVLFGGEKLPGFARGLGKSIREFKKAASGAEEEFKRAIEGDEPSKPTPTLPTALPSAAATPPTAPSAKPETPTNPGPTPHQG
jgi:TatA/E family protein of Tat protein translocase